MDICQRVISEPMPEKMAIKKAINDALTDFQSKLVNEELVYENGQYSCSYPILTWPHAEYLPDSDVHSYYLYCTSNLSRYLHQKTMKKPMSLSCERYLERKGRFSPCGGVYGIRLILRPNFFDYEDCIPESLAVVQEH